VTALRPLSLLALLLGCGTLLASPAEAVAAALKDALTVPPVLQPYTRYLWRGALSKEQWREQVQATLFWVPSLSRVRRITPIMVTGDLVRLNLDDYELDPKTWELFSKIDPYFHFKADEVVVEVPYERTTYQGHEWVREPGGQWVLASEWTKGKTHKEKRPRKVDFSTDWYDAKAMAALVAVTQSQAPILRADWWLVQTGRQVDLRNRQNGVGYYDWLKVKNRDDFDRLVDFDRKKAEKRGKDLRRAALDESGVSQSNRRVLRFQALNGGYWLTEDSNDSTDQSNVLRIADDENKHDAEEIYGVLANGLFAYFLCDDKGVRQDSAPDKAVGPDDSKYRLSRDGRIHVGVTCVRCHEKGLQNIDDWFRRTYQGPLQFATPAVDRETYKKNLDLRDQYLSDLDGVLQNDREQYFRVLKTVNGLESTANAKAMGDSYNRYVAPLNLDAAARELDVNTKFMLEQFGKLSALGKLDPLLAQFLSPGFRTIRRDHWEEVYGLGQLAIRGQVP
jgi:hypothetical protein